MHSSRFFRIKLIARLILKREISRSHTIADQSLLLSTIVLNDIAIFVAMHSYRVTLVYRQLTAAYMSLTSMHGKISLYSYTVAI